MALDPSIITNAMANWQTPAAFDPISQIAKIQALKNGITQQALQQQQLQNEQLTYQQNQRAFQDQQALDAAYRGAITTDANGNVSYDRAKVLSNVPGHLAPGIQKTLNEMDQAKATLDDTKAKAQTAQVNLLGSALLPIVDSGYDPETFKNVLTHAAGTGVIDPRQAAAWMQQLGPNPTPDQIKAALAPYLGAPGVQELLTKRQTADAATKRADAATQQADLAKEKERVAKVSTALGAAAAAQTPQELEAARKGVTDAGGTPAEVARVPMAIDAPGQPGAQAALRRSLLTAEQQTTADQAAANAKREQQNADRAARHDAVMEQLGFAHLKLSQNEYDQKYGDVLGQMSPNNLAIAQKLASGDFDPAQLGRMPGKEQIIAGAIQLNPNWNPQIYATKKSFTDPEKTQAKNLGTISRIVSHIVQFEQNSKDMGFAPAYAYGANLTGGQAKLNEDAQAISGELEKLVSGGVGSVEQTRQWQKDLHSPSADARQQAINEISQLVGGQYEGMNQTYKAATGSDLPIQKYVSPAGQNWMRSKGINVQGAAQPAPGGAPPLPSRLSAADVGKTYVNKAGKPIRITAVNPADPTQFKSQELP